MTPRRHSALLPALAGVVALTLAGCSGGDDAASPTPSTTSSDAPSTPNATSSSPLAGAPASSAPASSPPASTGSPPRLALGKPVATGLDVPWGIARLPGGSTLVAERDRGRIRLLTRGGQLQTAGTVPGVRPAGEGGLLGLAVAADFATNPLVYAYFTAAGDNRVVRMRYDARAAAGHRLGRLQVILRGIPKGFRHNGGRLLFGPDGLLYIGTGETGNGSLAQDKTSLGGKILRIRPDGSVPAGNPFRGSPVYSYGHRNVQGLAFDSHGRLWASEFGNHTWDELNRILPGRNYGWPVVEGIAHRRGYVDPVAQWRTDEASPSGLAIVGDVAYLASLRGQRLWQVPLAHPGRKKAWFSGQLGRLRTVLAAPGGLWVSTSNTDGRIAPRSGDDKIYRVQLR